MRKRKKAGSKRGFGLLEVLLVLGVIGLIAGGGWYAKTVLNEATEVETGNNALNRAQELQQMLDREAGEQVNQLQALDKLMSLQSSSSVATPTSAPARTEGWKTYRNEKYGFEFKYPSDEILDLSKVGEFHMNLPGTLFSALLYQPSLGKNAGCGFFPDTSGEMQRTCEGYLGTTFEIYPSAKMVDIKRTLDPTAPGIPHREDDITFWDTTWQLYTFSSGVGMSQMAYTIRGNDIYLITLAGELGEVDRALLSTFKFTK